MSKLRGKILTLMAVVIGGLIGVFATGNSVYADAVPGSFKIYAWVQSCAYYDGALVSGSCAAGTGNIANSAEVVVNEKGKVSVKNEKTSDAIRIKKEGDKLTIKPSCSMFNDCGGVSVDLSNNIDTLKNSVNGALVGKTWVPTNAAVGSSYYVQTQYTFSTTDVTRADAVTVPEDDLGAEATGETATVEPTCMNSDLDTLGWILCPIMDLLSGAAQGAYDEFVEPALQVDPVLFTGDGRNNGTQQAWGVFRNIANSLFIILLLIVIFSQLTGVGIDNYGIKKVLPKMIVAAILINLSYWICVIFVDLSNILGNGLQALFNNLPTGDVDAAASGIGLKGFSMGLLTAAGIAAALVTSVFAAGGGVALALTLFVSLIGVIISIFFLFILLAAREAAIVVLTVVSPVLIACYMLPNTKSMFDKWSKFLWALLMVYPIAGLLVGGGNFVSKLLLVAGAGSGDFFPAFVAMLAGIIPIFFIPTVLRNSLNAAGQLGAKISGMGQRVGSRFGGNVDKSIRGSERFKNYQTDRDRQRKINAARRTAARFTDENGNIRSDLSARQQRRVSQALAIQVGEEKEERERQNLLNGGYAAAIAGVSSDARNADIANRLTLMQSPDGGIRMDNGDVVAFNRSNAEARMKELEMVARGRALTDEENSEMAALAHGMVGMKGGASRINDIIRSVNDGNGGANRNFMAAMGQIYSQDSSVRDKMGEKDGTMGAYMEGYMPGGRSVTPDANGNINAESYADYAAGANFENRSASYEAGLNQGGQALQDYIGGLSASDCQNIYDQELNKILDTDDLHTFEAHAAALGVKGKSDTGTLSEINQQLHQHNQQQQQQQQQQVTLAGHITDQNGQKHPVFVRQDGRYVDRHGNDLGDSVKFD